MNERFELKLYSSFHDDNQNMLDKNGLTPYKVMFDEMKIESGIAFNYKGEAISGFMCGKEGNFSLSSSLNSLLKKMNNSNTRHQKKAATTST